MFVNVSAIVFWELCGSKGNEISGLSLCNWNKAFFSCSRISEHFSGGIVRASTKILETHWDTRAEKLGSENWTMSVAAASFHLAEEEPSGEAVVLES